MERFVWSTNNRPFLFEENYRGLFLNLIFLGIGGILPEEAEMEGIPISTLSPLYDSDLEVATHLCLEEAALTDRDQFPPGSGSLVCSRFHGRRKRFESALEKRMRGVESILELGLSSEDCSWAASKAHRAVDKIDWEIRFRTAAIRLRMNGL